MIPRAAQTVLGVDLKRTCSRVTSASSALGVINDYAPHKSAHSLSHSRASCVRLHKNVRDKLATVIGRIDNAAVDVPWRNFLSTEFRTKLQKEDSLYFWKYRNW